MEIKVENIKCNGCATSIKNSLSKMEGVHDVKVDVENGIVSLETEASANQEKIVSKLQSMGYPEPGKGSGLTTATSYVSCMIGRISN